MELSAATWTPEDGQEADEGLAHHFSVSFPTSFSGGVQLVRRVPHHIYCTPPHDCYEKKPHISLHLLQIPQLSDGEYHAELWIQSAATSDPFGHPAQTSFVVDQVQCMFSGHVCAK
eukprot:3687787-Rhodomonas_salina.2